MTDTEMNAHLRRFPRSAAAWAGTVTDPRQARPLDLADAFAAGRHPELLEHLGPSGDVVLSLRERHRVGLVHRVMEYLTMTASMLGASALFSGRLSPRVDYNFDATFAVPAAAVGFMVALVGLILVHLIWLRRGLPISATGVAAAAITAVMGAIAAILMPIKAADDDMMQWQPYLVPVLAGASVAALSCVLQVRWGVTRVNPDLDTPEHQRFALQWAALPERERTRIREDRDVALYLLADRGVISEHHATTHADRPFGQAL